VRLSQQPGARARSVSICTFVRVKQVDCCHGRKSVRLLRQHTPAYVSIRQHTPAYVSIRQHTPAYVSIRQHTPAYVSIRQHTRLSQQPEARSVSICTFLLPAKQVNWSTRAYAAVPAACVACVSIRQHTPAYASIRGCPSSLCGTSAGNNAV
jgi:hypothetical protein